MPGELALPSLEIHNFRGLQQLNISRLGRANLLTGKNNVGKTSVLEAIRLYARPASPELLLEILDAREEVGTTRTRRFGIRSPRAVPVERLFTGRTVIPGEGTTIRIGPMGAEERILSISLEWSRGLVARVQEESDEDEVTMRKRLGLVFRMGGKRRSLPIADVMAFARNVSSHLNRDVGIEGHSLPHLFVGSNGLDSKNIAALWDAVALTAAEADVSLALQLVAPEVERVTLIADAFEARERVVVARVNKFQDPIPLRSLGDGVNRMFGIILSIINARNGVLLVDEFENGLHYSVQIDIWRLIFRVAATLNVQVFATTHSSDCLAAFQVAASESEEEGVVVHLGRRGDSIVASVFDEPSLEIAVEAGMELRG